MYLLFLNTIGKISHKTCNNHSILELIQWEYKPVADRLKGNIL